MSDEEIIKEEAKEEEEVQEKPVSNTWFMDDLVSLTDEVQETFVLFRDKEVHFQFSELVEKEEPKFKPISDRASDDEKMAFYSEVGSKRILAMLTKANERNPEGPLITKEHWEQLPTTLRYQISNKIMGIEQESRENFPF